MLDTVTAFKTNPDLIPTNEPSGFGQFSEVSLTPCGKYAIKHGSHGFADGWLLFAAKLLSMPEDERPWWAPVIHSLRVDMETGSFTALLKAYEHEDGGPEACGLVSNMMRVIKDGLPYLHENDEYDDEYQLLLEAPEFDNAPIECVEFLYEIQTASGVDLYFDIAENSMFDTAGGHIVLNDPCCVKGWHYAKGTGLYKDAFREYLTKCAKSAPDMQLRGL